MCYPDREDYITLLFQFLKRTQTLMNIGINYQAKQFQDVVSRMDQRL